MPAYPAPTPTPYISPFISLDSLMSSGGVAIFCPLDFLAPDSPGPSLQPPSSRPLHSVTNSRFRFWFLSGYWTWVASPLVHLSSCPVVLSAEMYLHQNVRKMAAIK